MTALRREVRSRRFRERVEGEWVRARRSAKPLAVVQRVVRKLGASDRLVLLLTLVDRLTPAQVATRLGTRPDAARQRKLRAIRRVWVLLEPLSRPGLGGHMLTRGS